MNSSMFVSGTPIKHIYYVRDNDCGRCVRRPARKIPLTCKIKKNNIV